MDLWAEMMTQCISECCVGARIFFKKKVLYLPETSLKTLQGELEGHMLSD